MVSLCLWVSLPRHCTKSPKLTFTRATSITVVAAVLAGLALVFFVDPATHSYYPPCIFHAVTGLYCPGCGSLRALHQLLHGNLRAAMSLNPLFVLILPYLGYSLWLLSRDLIRGRSLVSEVRLHPAMVWAMLAIIVAFGVLRNLPFYPFTLAGAALNGAQKVVVLKEYNDCLSMRIAILQPGYLPCLGFFDQELSVDRFVLYDDVQYDRRGWRNRNRIKTPDGWTWLTVPVEQKGKYDQVIRDVKIDNDRPWRKKHIGTVETFYSKAPYFDSLFPEFAEIVSRDWTYLWELDLALIKWLNGVIGIATPIVLASELEASGQKSERLLDICKKLGATEYYSGAAAHHYLDIKLFGDAGIEVYFQEYNHPVYPQLQGEFVSHLSALDLAMIAAPESDRIIRSGTKWKKAT